jgi:ribosomal protein S18 acetylase RimI-like enzyme
LVVSPDASVSPTAVQRCVEKARASGYASVLTSAVSSQESEVFVDAGFSVQERLHLLALDLDTEPAGPVLPLARAARRDRPGVLAVDDLSFDSFWRLGPVGLRDALEATPNSRFRVGSRDGRVVAYAITGTAGRFGYLQRIAVHPDVRREGWGHALVADALRWIWRHGGERAYVNTQLENEHALALYRSFGFEVLPAGLCVLGRSL